MSLVSLFPFKCSAAVTGKRVKLYTGKTGGGEGEQGTGGRERENSLPLSPSSLLSFFFSS